MRFVGDMARKAKLMVMRAEKTRTFSASKPWYAPGLAFESVKFARPPRFEINIAEAGDAGYNWHNWQKLSSELPSTSMNG